MAWVKIDDGAPEHRKFLALAEKNAAKAPAAGWLWVCGLAYCNRQPQRDGFIPRIKVSLLYPMQGAPALADMLVEAGLWESVDGGYHVHDYHEYQPDAEQVEATSRARSEAGRRGGMASGRTRQANAKQTVEANVADGKQSGSKAEANEKQSRSNLLEAKPKQNEPPIPARPDPAASSEADPPKPPIGQAGGDADAEQQAPASPPRKRRSKPKQVPLPCPFDLDALLARFPSTDYPDRQRALVALAAECQTQQDYDDRLFAVNEYRRKREGGDPGFTCSPDKFFAGTKDAPPKWLNHKPTDEDRKQAALAKFHRARLDASAEAAQADGSAYRD